METLPPIRYAACNLMLQALELLDGAGEETAAIHLQQAIDVLTGVPIPRTDVEAAAWRDTPEARAIIARTDNPASRIELIMGRSSIAQLELLVEEELKLAGVSDDLTVKARHLDRASKYAAERESRMRSGDGKEPAARDAGNPGQSDPPQTMAQLFGRRLKRRRQDIGFSRAQLTERTGVSLTYLSRVERGRANPTLDVMIDLAESVGEEVWDMVRQP